MQDALAQIWAKRAQIDPAGKLEAWEDKVARNTARQYFRRARSRPEILTPFDEDDDVGAEGSDPEATALLHSRMAVLEELVGRIAISRRAIFVDHHLLGKPLAEIAQERRIPYKTVEARLTRAWQDIDRAKTRWQAEQCWRGHDSVPAFPLLMKAVDLKAWARRGVNRLRELITRSLALIGPAAVIVGVLLSTPWSPVRLSGPALSGLPSARSMMLTPYPSSTGNRAGASATNNAPVAPVGVPDPAARRVRERERSSLREDAIISQAQIALRAGSVAEALQLLAEHEREFPRGRLAPVRQALLKRVP